MNTADRTPVLLVFYVTVICVMKEKFQGCESIINGSPNLDSWSGKDP